MFLEKQGEAFSRALSRVFSMEASRHYGEKMTSMTAMDSFQAVGENRAYPWTTCRRLQTLEHDLERQLFVVP